MSIISVILRPDRPYITEVNCHSEAGTRVLKRRSGEKDHKVVFKIKCSNV